jgi:hypothetical protein
MRNGEVAEVSMPPAALIQVNCSIDAGLKLVRHSSWKFLRGVFGLAIHRRETFRRFLWHGPTVMKLTGFPNWLSETALNSSPFIRRNPDTPVARASQLEYPVSDESQRNTREEEVPVLLGFDCTQRTSEAVRLLRIHVLGGEN